jgi:hypothetical protein
MKKFSAGTILGLMGVLTSDIPTQAFDDINSKSTKRSKIRNNWDQWQEHKKKECEKRRAKKKANKRRKK